MSSSLSFAFVESNTSGTGPQFVRAAARLLGFKPVLLTSDPARYRFVDEGLEMLVVDTKDPEALVGACRKLISDSGLAGVTSSSEYFVAAAAELAGELGLPGPSAAAVKACRDKQEQRERLLAAGIGVPAFEATRTVEEAVAAARALSFPVVVKPVGGTGSSGVRLCSKEEEARVWAQVLLRTRHNERGLPVAGRVLVEELAVGPEYSVETFGKKVVGITRKYLGALPHFVEVGHDFPARLAPHVEADTENMALGALEALGLGWGAAHLELRLTQEGPKIIEVNPRLAGGHIPDLVRLASGVDMILETVRLASGEQPRPSWRAHGYASIRFVLSPSEGVLTGVRGLSLARRMPEVVEARLYRRVGEQIPARGDFRDRIGHILTRANTPEAARKAAENAHRSIELAVEREALVERV